MKNKSIIKDAFKFCFFIGIAVLLVFLFLRQLTDNEIDEIKEAFSNINYLWLLPAIIFGVVSHILRALRWRMLLTPLDYKPKMWNMIFSVSVAYFANLAVPRLGEVARCGILRKYEKIPFTKSFGTVITERVVDMLVFLLIFVINILVQSELAVKCLTDITSQSDSAGLIAKVIFVALAAVVVVFVFALILYMKKKKVKSKFFNIIVEMINGFSDGIKTLFRLKSPITFIFYSVMIWIAYLYMSKMVFYCLPQTSILGYDAAFSGLAFCTIGTILIPGGIGLYPILAAAIYSLYGISSATGFALGWLIWTNQTIVIIIAGIFSLIVLPLYNKTSNDRVATK